MLKLIVSVTTGAAKGIDSMKEETKTTNIYRSWFDGTAIGK